MDRTSFAAERTLGVASAVVALVAAVAVVLALSGGVALLSDGGLPSEPGDSGPSAEATVNANQSAADRSATNRSAATNASSFENATVVATSERKADGGRANFIAAYAPDGSVLYRNDSRRVYNDVDPVPGETSTVEYVAAERLGPEECDAETACWKNVYERVNMSTGEVTRIYAYVTSTRRGQLHDMDRIGPDRLLVADIARDRVFVVNTTGGVIEWEWQAQSDFDFASGGPFPGDWTHLNDADLLDDGRIMVSLRNQDQVVFLDRETGVVENWTLGSDDDHDVLYEQHNPDYIPAERGGPAVVLADSENDRVAEFQREGGEWERVWTWSDEKLEWPRDADRLPNGNTLATDTDGGRVLEVAPNGSVVWSVEVRGGYDAERLGTGDGSANGTATGGTGESETTTAAAAATSASALVAAVR